MPSKNMLPKGKRRQSVKQEYRAMRTQIAEREAELQQAGVDAPVRNDPYDTGLQGAHVSPFAGRAGLVTSGPSGGKHPQEEASQSQKRYAAPMLLTEETPAEIHVLEDLEPEEGVRSFTAESAAAGMRLDAYLARALPDVSRARVQLLTENGQVKVDGKAAKSKLKLKGGEHIEIEGEPQTEPLHATPEDIPLAVVYEDDDLAVINKPAGMMVHAGAGDEERNRGTLVNALLFHLGKDLSQVNGELRPGIVHRLDKQTSGLIVVAKNDATHRKLSEMFATRRLRKVYLALVQGWLDQDEGTVTLPIARDTVRRTRMTTRRSEGRSAVSHWRVLERIDSPYGKFSLLEVRIETGRTHQIRVHMQALGHPVVGDTLYGAPHRIPPTKKGDAREALELDRNFLHAAELTLDHPRTGKELHLEAPLPPELAELLDGLREG